MASKYLQWNSLIGGFFFKPEQAGKIVTLVLSEEDIISIAKNSKIDGLENLDEAEILIDFKSSWRIGYPGTTGNYVERINQEDSKALPFLRTGRFPYTCAGLLVDYPPTLFHLAGINLAIIEGTEESRYDRIRKYFGLKKNEFPNMSETLNWNSAWEHLITWANDFMQGSLGTLPSRSLSKETFEYMGKPYTFILLSRNQLNDFHKFFYENDIEPHAAIEEDVLIRAFKKVRGNDHISNLLNSDTTNKDRALILAILRQLYIAWDGSYTNRQDSSGVKINFQSRKLRLSFVINDNGYFDFSFRFKEETIPDSELQIDGRIITFSSNQWSSPIPVTAIPGRKIFTDESTGLKLTFKPTEPDLFIFTSGRSEGLNSDIYIENPTILRAGNQYLLIKHRLEDELSKWILTNGGINVSDEYLYGEEKNAWVVFQFAKGFSSEYNDWAKLTLAANSSVEILSGLKGNENGEFIAGFPVLAKLHGASGGETLKLSGPIDYLIPLLDGQLFEIPRNITPGNYNVSIENTGHSVTLPNYGKLSISRFSSMTSQLDDLSVIEPLEERNGQERTDYNQSISLISNRIHEYPPPPQFTIWSADLINWEEIDHQSQTSIDFLDYLVTKNEISKQAFSEALSIISGGEDKNGNAFQDFSRTSTYTINGLRESSRILTISSAGGSLSRVKTVRPWIFRLGNFQNFLLKGSITGIKPFSGRLYVLGGAYTKELLKRIQNVCSESGGELKLYQEGTPATLIPPTVFIYTKDNSTTITAIANLIEQNEILPYFRYITYNINIVEKIEEFKNGRMWDLHMVTRYQAFNHDDFLFKKTPGIHEPPVPSLSFYEVKPWEKYFILRFEDNGKKFEGVIDPRWGKYISLHYSGINNVFFFDQQKNILFIPAALRLPSEIETNLFYYTGRLPSVLRLHINEDKLEITSNFRCSKTYLAYKGILKASAETVANKVGQQLTFKTFIDHD